MNLLLDTHVLLWWPADDARLGRRARTVIAAPSNTIWVSAASAWEIAIKTALGRLRLPGPPAEILPAALADNDFRPLPIAVAHALAAGALAPVHGDPFDRMLIAQASTDGLTIITADALIARYAVPVLPAGE